VRTAVAGLLIIAAAFGPFTSSLSAQQETIVAIQVHGNTLTPDAEVITASGLMEGTAFSEDVIAAAAVRLKNTKRYDRIEILKRYASITDTSQVIVVIQVDEGPVRIDMGPLPGVPTVPGLPGRTPHVVKRGPVNMMFVPLLDAEDGYGLAYGARMALTGHRDTSARVVIPASWGGDKRVGAEFQKEFGSRLAPQLRLGGLLQRRTHPFYETNADRKRVWARGEWPIVKVLRAGVTTAWQKTSMTGRDDRMRSVGGDLVFDTRLDPILPRNAVFARSAVDRLSFTEAVIVRTSLEANGYLGLFGGTVLALRAAHDDMSRPAPPYYKAILGGSSNLRGFRAGYAVGDTLSAFSAEVRTPLTSPLNFGRFGTSLFVDAARAYDKGEKLRDRPLKKGVGAGIWTSAAVFHMSLAFAHGMGQGNRVHFSAGFTF
jgi:outer membrane protein assembly factor BamA